MRSMMLLRKIELGGWFLKEKVQILLTSVGYIKLKGSQMARFIDTRLD
jgi:hypothetical protein